MNRTLLRVSALPVALLAGLTFIAGCGDDSGHDMGSMSTSDSGAKFNDADVTFATEMIQHHAQALSMVDLTRGRQLDQEFADLTSDIQDAQGPEITTMTTWLDDWDEPVPSTMRDHANAGHDMEDMEGLESTDDMPGMMSTEQMSELEAATGATFRTLWLEMMIEHHEGAIEMAKTEIDDGANADAVDLAKGIVTAQTAEIDRIEKLLG